MSQDLFDLIDEVTSQRLSNKRQGYTMKDQMMDLFVVAQKKNVNLSAGDLARVLARVGSPYGQQSIRQGLSDLHTHRKIVLVGKERRANMGGYDSLVPVYKLREADV